MRVVILHQHFKDPAEGGAIRSYYLARALVSRGHDVVVVAGHNGSYRETALKGIRIYWLPVKYENRFGFFQRSVSFLDFVVEVARRPKMFRSADLCYAMSVPLTTGLAALYLKKFYSIPYVFEIGDLWPDAPVEMGFVKNPLLIHALYRLEKTIYKNATKLISLSPAITAALRKKTQKGIVTIPNMADTVFFKPGLHDMQNEPQKQFVISYFGSVGFANGLEHMVLCALECQRAGVPARFVICGEGACLNELKDQVRQLGVSNLVFIPLQSRNGVRRLMDETDAVWVSYRPFPILETGSPNKYFDGLAAGKLIILNFGGWIREEVEGSKCGVYVDPKLPGAAVAAIRPFILRSEQLSSYQRASRRLAEQRYSRIELSEEFSQAIETAFSSTSSR